MTRSTSHFQQYDPEEIARYYRWRFPLVVWRTVSVLLRLAWFCLGSQSDRLLGRQSSRQVQRRASQLRALLADLGPTFIKVGQALSTRPDLVRVDYLEELTKLQDQLPSFPTTIARAIIERELGDVVEEIYAYISPRPVAAASLGQVYRARLSSGEDVAVKVQRPYLRRQLTLDLYIIRWVSTWVYRWLPLNLGQSLTAVVDEFGSKLFEEIDYLNEGRNCERFAGYFDGDLDVYVPKIYWKYSSKRVLTLEWIDGIKLTDTAAIQSANLDIQSLIRIGVESALKQLLEYGFFHADPHPGNLFALRDGRLAFIDFGMMDQLSQDKKERLVGALVHMVNQDYESLVEDFLYLQFISDSVDTAPIVPAMQVLMDDILNEKVGDFNFKTATDRFSQLVYEYPFRVPPNFALIIRSLVTLEGVALSLYPDFKIIGVAYPYVARRLLTDESPALRKRLLDVLFKDSKFRWNRLENLIGIARTDSSPLDLSGTAQMGLRYLLSDEAGDLRIQIVLALTEDDRLHVEEVRQLWELLQPDLTPDHLLQRAAKAIREALPEVVTAPIEQLSRLLPN
nr:AarF/ABC1/UbiB kinase family protein [Synechococcus sp. PCC 7336]